MPIQQHVSFTVAHLPTTEFGHRAPLWWAIILTIAIEATVFALAFASYLYLRLQEPTWPPPSWGAPDVLYGSATTALLLVSAWPIYRLDVESRRVNGPKVRQLLLVFFALSAVIIAARSIEFYGLQVKWDSNAYGSMVWFILVYHTLHIITSVAEAGIIAAYVFTHPLDKKHALDLHVTAVYWYFVVASVLPLWVLVYLGRQILN